MHDSRSRDHFDDIIDDAARSMTRGVPGESLRAGVRARIEQPAPAGRRVFGVPGWQMGLAAAVAVVIAIVVGQNGSAPSDEPREVAPARAVNTAPPPLVTVPESIPPPRDAPGVDRPRTRVLSSVAALAAPEPIVIESLDVEPMGPQLTAVDTIAAPMPIVIEPLRVEPLSME